VPLAGTVTPVPLQTMSKVETFYHIKLDGTRMYLLREMLNLTQLAVYIILESDT
jgi:hypothetical protein